MIYPQSVIEKRDHNGRLDFSKPQPADIFGLDAIHGITEDQIAKVVWRHCPDAKLDGRDFFKWAAMVDPAFRTRTKTW